MYGSKLKKIVPHKVGPQGWAGFLGQAIKEKLQTMWVGLAHILFFFFWLRNTKITVVESAESAGSFSFSQLLSILSRPLRGRISRSPKVGDYRMKFGGGDGGGAARLGGAEVFLLYTTAIQSWQRYSNPENLHINIITLALH